MNFALTRISIEVVDLTAQDSCRVVVLVPSDVAESTMAGVNDLSVFEDRHRKSR